MYQYSDSMDKVEADQLFDHKHKIMGIRKPFGEDDNVIIPRSLKV